MPKAILGRRLSNELLLARIATLVIAVFAAVFALNAPDQLVALLGTFGWSVFAAAIVPVVAIGFNWKRATALAANVAMVSSMFTIFFVEFIYIKALGNGVPYGINTGAIAIIVSMFLFFTISLLSPPPKLDPEIEKVMDL
jgi:Na+/proline symporter